MKLKLMVYQLCKSSAVILYFFLVPTLGWALGTSISFQSASIQENTRLITYEYGNLGKRVLHDTDGQASLVALLALMKQEYFRQKPASDSETFKNWKQYRPAVTANLSRLHRYYKSLGFCDFEVNPDTADFEDLFKSQFKSICEAAGILKRKLNKNSVRFSDVFELSNYLRNVEEHIGLAHTYPIDRYNPDGTKRDQREDKASYMFSTKNLNVWLPDQESVARCKDHHVAENNSVVAQLAQGVHIPLPQDHMEESRQ